MKALEESETGAEVSCIGAAGIVINLGNGVHYDKMAKCTTV